MKTRPRLLDMKMQLFTGFALIIASGFAVAAQPVVELEYLDGTQSKQVQELRENQVFEDGIEFINEAFELECDLRVICAWSSVPRMVPYTIRRLAKSRYHIGFTARYWSV